MKYADRYGNRWEETGLQDRFLEKLYKSVPGRAVVKVLVHPWVSRMGGWILSQKASCWLIPLFLKGHPMDESGWVKQRFTSYNDFFMRKLKPGQRRWRKIRRGSSVPVMPNLPSVRSRSTGS